MTTWTEALATGIPEIDAQHRELFSQVERLREAVQRGQLACAPDALDFLARYVTQHFAAEERLMAAADDRGLPAHRVEHEAFLSTFVTRKAEYEASRSAATLLIELCDWLSRWLDEHVCGVDAEMARMLAASPRPSLTQR